MFKVDSPISLCERHSRLWSSASCTTLMLASSFHSERAVGERTFFSTQHTELNACNGTVFQESKFINAQLKNELLFLKSILNFPSLRRPQLEVWVITVCCLHRTNPSFHFNNCIHIYQILTLFSYLTSS